MTTVEENLSVRTSRFGRIAIEASKAIEIQGGLIGFPKSTRFAILDHEPKSPFKWMQSLDDGDLAFVITDPLVFFPEYKVNFRREELLLLQIENEDDIVVFVIVSVQPQARETTANLQGPIIVNAKKRLGRQIVLKDVLYSTQHRIFPDIA